MSRFLPALIGAVGGLAFGFVWWLVWGCQVCAPGSTPWGPIAFTAVVGTGLGHVLGKDHVRPPG